MTNLDAVPTMTLLEQIPRPEDLAVTALRRRLGLPEDRPADRLAAINALLDIEGATK